MSQARFFKYVLTKSMNLKLALQFIIFAPIVLLQQKSHIVKEFFGSELRLAIFEHVMWVQLSATATKDNWRQFYRMIKISDCELC